jgi:hypothetical protein
MNCYKFMKMDVLTVKADFLMFCYNTPWKDAHELDWPAQGIPRIIFQPKFSISTAVWTAERKKEKKRSLQILVKHACY